MKAVTEYARMRPGFWGHVKLVSQNLRYSAADRSPEGLGRLRRYSISDIRESLRSLNLSHEQLDRPCGDDSGRTLGEAVSGYLNRRSDDLEGLVQPNLMNRDMARVEFERLRQELRPTCPLPWNKQKGEKKHPAFMVGIVNMLTEHALGGRAFDGSPRGLTIATAGGIPARTFSRWMDGAYPSLVDPHAVWEVKEYYGTTTFGSRVADGVYETMLDGYELRELAESEGRQILHYLIVDDHFTWWVKGRSYLCRILDMLHQGLVDEVLFGREVLTRWPQIVRSWP